MKQDAAYRQRVNSVQSADDERKHDIRITASSASSMAAALVFLISFMGSWILLWQRENINLSGILQVLLFGWISAVATGFGAAPLLLFPTVSKTWLGICNAMAAGMMSAASALLMLESFEAVNLVGDSSTGRWLTPILGAVIGILFMSITQRVLEQYNDLKFSGLKGADARRVLLIFTVMTIHSFAEGVGMGTSFGRNSDFGAFISITIALHNVPEGLAVALVMVSSGVSAVDAGIWGVLTSVPQPLMAVPSYLFVQSFLAFLPIGLAFAASAMMWVVVIELFPDACDELGGRGPAGLIAFAAAAALWWLQQTFEAVE